MTDRITIDEAGRLAIMVAPARRGYTLQDGAQAYEFDLDRPEDREELESLSRGIQQLLQDQDLRQVDTLGNQIRDWLTEINQAQASILRKQQEGRA